MSEKQAVAVKLFGALTVHTCPQPFPFKSVLGGGRAALQGKSTSLKKASRLGERLAWGHTRLAFACFLRREV